MITFGVIRLRGPRSVPVTQMNVVDAVYGLGTVTAEQTWQLTLGVTASLVKILVREGDAVASGAPLAQFDTGPVVRAPFQGMVTSVTRKIGELVFAQSPVLTVVNLGTRDLTIPLEQDGALRVKPGLPARVHIDALDLRLDGRVRTLYPNAGQFMARIDVPNLPPTVLPGMTADIAIEIEQRANALIVPLRALEGTTSADTDQATLTVRRDGRTQTIHVRTGVVVKDQIEIRDGLQPTDRVVEP